MTPQILERGVSKTILLLMYSSLLTCAHAATEPWPSSPSDIFSRTLIIGGDANYPPFHFINDQGVPAGFDVDLGEAIAGTIGCKVEFQLGDTVVALRNLEQGIVDVVPMFISAKRASRYDVSQPYIMSYHLIYGHEKSPPVEGIDQLGGKEIILQRGGYVEESLRETGINMLPVLTNDAAEVLILLATGKYDYGLLPENTARFVIDKYNLASLRIIGPPVLAENYGFAVRKGNTELLAKLNEGLGNLKQTGQFDLIYKRWFVTTDSITEIEHSFLKNASLIFLPIFLALLASLVFSRRLRSKVGQQADALSTEQTRRRKAEKEAQYLAYNDILTGLPNRNSFILLLEATIEDARADNRKFAVYSFKIMNLSDINQLGGYEVGTQLLKIIGADMKAQYSKSASAFLPGQFCVMMDGMRDTCDIHDQIQTLLHRFYQPKIVQGVRIDLQFRSGYALYPDDGTDAEVLIRNAELAQSVSIDLEQAYIGYSRQYEPDPRNLTLMADLRQALQEHQIRLFCQPKVDLLKHAVIGGEVLVRWHHPKFGELEPDIFIPLAEKFGLIRELTMFVIEQVVIFMDNHFRKDEQIKLSVNVSAKDFATPDFATRTIALVKDWTDHLVLEITETATTNDKQSVLKSVMALQEAGIVLSIDDFGTGYSSLSYIKQLNPVEIKIDKSFVKNLCTSPNDQVVVISTINMAHGLNIQVVAEGSEDTETVRLLADLNCDIAQGHALARPMPIEDFWKWVQRGEIIDF